MRSSNPKRHRMPKARRMEPSDVHDFVRGLFAEDMHAKRVLSLGNGVLGVMYAASLSVHAIGIGLSKVRDLSPKHSIKQVDRLLSNTKLDVWETLGTWAPLLIAERKEIIIVLDWTDFDSDDHAVLAAYLVTNHVRATPLACKTVKKSELKGERNAHEDELLLRLREIIPRDVKVTLLADRGFGDQALYTFLHELGGTMRFVFEAASKSATPTARSSLPLSGCRPAAEQKCSRRSRSPSTGRQCPQWSSFTLVE